MLLFPNAKINIGLYITEKRADGFHNLQTCFYPVNWLDALEVIEEPAFRFTSTGIHIPGDANSNLCINVYAAVKEHFDIPSVHIHLHKNIPIGAGLGGGSADAAFTLKALNRKFGLGLSDADMEALVRPIGSDCAFFIKNKPTLAYGRGNEFEGLNLSLKGYCITMVYPAIEVSTKEAYAGVTPKQPAIPLKEILEQDITNWKGVLVNDFEESVFKNHPALPGIKQQLYEAGALYASMSGSGSCMYGIFKEAPALSFPANYKVWQGLLQ